MRETLAISKRGTRRPNNQMTTPTQISCTGVSLLVWLFRRFLVFFYQIKAYAIKYIFWCKNSEIYFELK
jgi:hypothetical protein